MAKAILTKKINPAYDDRAEFQYHFPKTYLNQIKAAVGDQFIYYEPRRQDEDPSGRAGRRAYFAVGRITGISEDPVRPDHYYAHIADYIDFERPVPFREGYSYYESALKKGDGSTNRGAFGRSVRNIPDHEFESICSAGFVGEISEGEIFVPDGAALYEAPAPYQRRIVEQVVKRPFREAAFSRNIRSIYQSRCAFTGVRILSVTDKVEMEAAHIRPVDDSGPDSVRNGIALCRTMHWMFDNGLVSMNNDATILLDEKRVPEKVRQMVNPDHRAFLPKQEFQRPHAQFLEYHRDVVFKG